MVGYAPPGNTDTAYRYFLEHGWTPAQAAGIVGNLMQESGPSLDPTIAGDGGAAYGIAQWNDRRPALFDWAQSGGRDPGDLQTQLDYIQHELGTTESRAADALRRAQTPQDAASAFLGFERPAGFSWSDPTGSHGYDNRVANALSLYGGGTMPQPMSSMPAGTAAGGQDMATGGLLGVQPAAAPALQQSWLGGLLDIQPSEEQGLLGQIVNPQNSSDRQAIMQMAAAMLQASGPSTEPRGFGTSLGAGLQGYAQGQAIGARQDENKLRAQARAQMEAMIAALPPEQQALARANPAAFSELMMQRQFAGPAAPINAGGGLFLDPTTMQPVADYRQPDAPKPMEINGQLVDPTTGRVMGDYRSPETPSAPTTRTVNRGGVEVQQEWNGSGWTDVGAGPRWAPPDPSTTGPAFKDERSLAAEFEKAAAPFAAVQQSYSAIQNLAQDPTGASDIALVYALFKTIDPTSTVRESEFASAAGAMGLPEQFVAEFQSLANGQFLSPQMRQDIISVAQQYYQQQSTDYSRMTDYYTKTATDYGFDPERVLRPIMRPEGSSPSPTPSAPGGATSVSAPGAPALDLSGMSDADADKAFESMPSGTVYIGPDGNQYRKP